jgi:hypothetical protein
VSSSPSNATVRVSPDLRSRSSTSPSSSPRPDDDRRRHADQLGVLEGHAGRDLGPVVEQHDQAALLERRRQPLGLGLLLALADADDVHVDRRDERGQTSPFSSWDCSAMAATARETPMPYEPMVTRTGLLSGPSTSRPKASANLRPSWKMWPISMPAADLERRAAAPAGVAGAHLGGRHDAGRGEVAAHDDVDGVLARLVGAGRPGAARTTSGSTT